MSTFPLALRLMRPPRSVVSPRPWSLPVVVGGVELRRNRFLHESTIQLHSCCHRQASTISPSISPVQMLRHSQLCQTNPLSSSRCLQTREFFPSSRIMPVVLARRPTSSGRSLSSCFSPQLSYHSPFSSPFLSVSHINMVAGRGGRSSQTPPISHARARQLHQSRSASATSSSSNSSSRPPPSTPSPNHPPPPPHTLPSQGSAQENGTGGKKLRAPMRSSQSPESFASSMSKYLHLPHMRQAPTKEELLDAATGFWPRLRVRFKWFSIRSMRPWNMDEWSGFFSLFMVGGLVWIILGTTTFFSALIFGLNTMFAQETLARWVGDYLTKSAGVTVVFESAIVPRWNDGVISFKNVFVSRRPGQTKSSVSKGSSIDAAAVAAAERNAETPVKYGSVDDGNYTQFDVTLNTVNVTLSFYKWWNGKGLVKSVEIKGVRGVVDRTNVKAPAGHVDPYSLRQTHKPGDFELDQCKLEDLLVTVHQPGGFRPFSVSIFSCELPRLRKYYLFYDILSATHMSGSFDGALFTIHPRQVHGDTQRMADTASEEGNWDKFSRMRIDGLRIDHLNRGVDGPFGWIYDGNVDVIANVMFPEEPEGETITKVVSHFYDKIEDAVVTSTGGQSLQQETQHETQEEAWDMWRRSSGVDNRPGASGRPRRNETGDGVDESDSTATLDKDGGGYFIMDMRIHLNDVKAAVPIFTKSMSYVNQALVRPIVAYINTRRTYIPINCRVVKPLSDFDGSWSLYDCGLMHDMSAETYEAFASDVQDQQTRTRRLRSVGFWTVSLFVHALFLGLAGNVL